jgi:membrane protein YdbS with pleckstrin-like domain
MNPITFECPHCHELNGGDESMHGQQVQCRKCQATILIPPAPVRTKPQTARLVPDPAAAASPGPGGADPESDIFVTHPVARAYFGQILFGMILIAVAAGLVIRAHDFTWPRWVPLVPLVLGLLVLLLVWIKVRSYRYRLTSQRLFVRRGWWAREVHELELYRVKDVVVDQGALQRLLGYGTITVISEDESTPKLELSGVSRPLDVKETLRTHYRAARQREGVRPTEFIDT